MECNVPTDITFSFAGLALRGGCKGPHADGWGLALYEGKAARTFIESAPAHDSPLATFVREHPIRTLLAIAHVRKRTRGAVSLVNTHPFVRELFGRHFVFAHNGTVRNVRRFKTGRFTPIGSTDSEWAFCALLNGLQNRFGTIYPTSTRELWNAVAEISGRIGREGTFNFLLADGQHLFARCSTKLHHIVRKAPFASATLCDDDVQVDFAKLTKPGDRVAVVATQPLTRDEAWVQAEADTLWVFRGGQLRATLESR